ncbi:Leucyl aminopeptidase (aminopeptidase T)-like [Hymenobacter roseosalivarius DSM 11622]|uniref:Leucyl aminopeptidase (Aminopeptidase T)-like n=2 Tax=Hymenobacter roseosalivarius TaxID=89967 RepID=A0A1W1UTM4_9BACT|nr:Leucyl aminopeptidase (aminopeptidase T)-like [Hymenobacter roseosalivarius DSM 11622]
MASPVFGQNYEQIAKQIVNTSAGVKPGELVMITGGKHTMPLMEAIAVEVARVGGQPEMMVNTDKVAHAIDVEMPESAIQASKSDNWLLQADVLITLPQLEDSKAVLAGITPARQAKFAKVAADAGLSKKLDAAKIRGVFVSYPSKSLAANQQLDYPSYEQMIWAGIGTDYTAVATQAQQLKQLLTTGKKVHITSPTGTNLTFQLAARPVFVDDGVLTAADQQEKLIYNRTASLPGGRIYGTCQETSATGRLEASPTTWNGKPMQGFKAELKNGQLANSRADAGSEDFQKSLASYDPGMMQLGYFSIGLNPAMKPQEQKGFNPSTAAGMVYLAIGNNELLGGQNQAATSYSFPIANATVEVDGTVVVRNGQLVSPTVAKAAPMGKKAQK